MGIITTKNIEGLEKACQELLKEKEVIHVGVVNGLGKIIAGGFRDDVEPFLDDEKIGSVYMQMMLDFRMREELNSIMGEIDYIVSRRENYVIVNIPHGGDLVIIFAKKDSDDKEIVKKAEKLFDKIQISSFSFPLDD